MMADANEQSAEPVGVLMVVDDDVLSRMGGVVRHLCVGMLDEAVRMRVLARSGAPVADDAIGPVRVANLPRQRWPWPQRSPTADELLRRLGGDRPQVVHCLSADLARWVRRWAGEWDSVLMVHLMDLADVRLFQRLRPRDRMLGIAATADIGQTLHEECPGLQSLVRVVPLGVPAGSEPVCLADPQRAPAAVITTPLTRDCGLDVVLKALQSMVKAGQDVQLFILATGPAERQFRRQVEQLGLRSRVTFAGPIGDWTTLGNAMGGADFYILPTARARFTIHLLMAMASGLAVLAPTGTIGGDLTDGVTACLFDPQAPRQLAEKWGAMLEDHAVARRLAQGALNHIRASHQASAMVSAIAGLYRELGRPKPVGIAAAGLAGD